MGFKYATTTYRIAYEIKDYAVIPLLLCEEHENFYEQIKKIREGLGVIILRG